MTSDQGDLTRHLVNNSPEFMAVLRGPDHVFELANRAYFELVGNRALIGKPFREVLPELEAYGIFEELDEVFRTGVGKMRRTVATSLRLTGEQPPQQLYIETNRIPYFEEDGSVGGVMVYGRDVTDQTLTEQSLRDAQHRSQRTMDQLLMFLNATDEGYYVVDCEGVVTTCNNQFLKMLGFDRHDEIMNRHLHEVIHHTHADGSPYPRSECPIYQTARSGKAAYVPDELFFRRDGSSLAVQYHVYPIWDGKELQGALCIFRDITQRKRDEAALLESAQRSKSLFEQHSDAIFSVDTQGRILSANPSAQKLTGYSESELHQCPAARYFSQNDDQRIRNLFAVAFNHILDDKTLHSLQAALLSKDGKQIEVEVTNVPILVGTQCVGVYLIMRDVTESLQHARSIKHLATHDTLTGLANRALLYERLGHAIDYRRQSLIGLLFLDLNRFKVINDSLGHDKGDLLLQILARRFRAVMREGDTIARLGGDEFVVLVEECQSLQNIVDVVEKIQAAVNESFDLDGHQAHVSTSIGAAVFPRDGQDVGTLMRHADLAMYEAKSQGAPHFRFFNAELNRKAMQRMQAESDLRQALTKQQLILLYQPIVAIPSRNIIGVEALIRWQHPERGILAPTDFIGLAEEIGMIDEIGNWTLLQACRQNRCWQSEGLKPVKIAVNLSVNQLKSPGFAQTLERTLTQTGLEPQWLELEITESVLMQNFQASSAMLDAIRALGVSVSIDDFGTGYSSLSYLQKLPIDTLKIDRSFIDDVTEDTDNAMIVAATITLAHNLGLNVVAEGVTKPEQVSFLTSNHCTVAQGYLFSLPLSANDLHAYLSS
ncbi:MAG: EAL domain-containing protein [Pseudomonadota bacterium]